MIRMDVRAATLLLLTLWLALGLLTFVNLPSLAETFDGSRAVMNGDTFALGKERARILNISARESLHSRCGWELSLERKGPFLWAAQYMGILSWNCCPRPKFFRVT
jgi:hypothetical protein